MDTENAKLRSWQKLWTKRRTFLLKIRKTWKTFSSEEKNYFSWELSLGQFDWIFDYPNQKLPTRSRKLLLNVRNWKIVYNTNETISPQFVFFWTRRMQFSQLGRNNPDKEWKFFAKCSSIFKKSFCFKKLSFLKCSYGHVNWSFDNTACSFLHKAENPAIGVRCFFMPYNFPMET